MATGCVDMSNGGVHDRGLGRPANLREVRKHLGEILEVEAVATLASIAGYNHGLIITKNLLLRVSRRARSTAL